MKKLLSISTLTLIVCLATATGCSLWQSTGIDDSLPSVSTPSAQTTVHGDRPSLTTSLAITSLGAVTTAPLTTAPLPADTFPPPVIGGGPALEYISTEGQPQLQKIIELAESGTLSGASCWDRFMLVNLYGCNDVGYYEDADVGESPSYEEWTDLLVIDLLTGKTTATYHYDYALTAGFLEDGSIYLYRNDPLTIKVYDRTGALSFSYNGEESGQVCIDAADGVAWVGTWESALIDYVPLNGDPAQTYTLPDAESYFIQTAVGGSAYVTVFGDRGSTELVMLTAEGKIEDISALHGYYSVDDALCNEAGDNWYYVSLEQPIERINSFGVDDGESYMITANDGRFCLQGYDYEGENEESKLILCLPSSGRRTDITLSEVYLCGQCWSDDALYLFLSDGESTALYLWDYQSADFERLETSVHIISETEKENLNFADKFEQDTGVSVYFSEVDMGRVPSDYIAEPLGDQQLISEKLSELLDVLDDYPDGFFVELPYGDYDHLEIYLCAGLSPVNSNGVDTAIAISNTSGTALLIVLDVTCINDLPETFAHELMHMMEKRIDQIDPSLLADWSSLTPGGDDAYYFSYHDEDGNEMSDGGNTWYGEEDPELIYFVDAYSKSYPTEDRARIFEFLVGGKGDPFFSDLPILMAKAERLCEIIRLTFPSVANADSVIWEVA